MKGTIVFKIVGWVILGVLIAGLLGLALGLAVMLLWNWLMPVLFGLPEIGYFQAVGIFVLCHLLFKSHVGHHDKHHSSGHDRFHDRIRDKVKEHFKGGHFHCHGEPRTVDVKVERPE